jgi:hypothetical protein
MNNETTAKDFSQLETFGEELLTNSPTNQENKSMTAEQLNEELTMSNLSMDLKSLISECEFPKGNRSWQYSYKNILFAKEVKEMEVTTTVEEAIEDITTIIIKAYRKMLHNASLKCHFNDVKVTPWEYAELQNETVGEWLVRTNQPMNVCVPLKGDN